MAKAHRLPSGTWRCIASWTDEYKQHKQKSFTGRTKAEAELLAAQFLTEKKHSMVPENKTLNDLILSFCENRSSLLSPTTLLNYDKIRRTAFPSIMNVRLGLLTPELYQRAVNEYASNHKYKTVLNAHALVNKVLKANDCFIAEKVLLPQKEKKEVSIPTEEEVKMLLNNLEGTRLYLFVAFSVFLGLRRSETIGLKWRDIDFDRQTVSVGRARVKGQSGVFVEKAPKTTESKRTLSIPSPLMDALPSKDKVNLDAYIIDDSIEALDSLYRRTTKKLGFNYNFHALRHFFASVLLAENIPNKYAQKLMGHATDNMLKQVYQHTFKKKEEEYEAMIDARFSSFGPKKE